MRSIVEFAGQDLEEAIAAAAGALNLPPEQLKFSVLEMGAKGFLGLGRRRARIAVDPADPALFLEEVALPPPLPPNEAETPPDTPQEEAVTEEPPDLPCGANAPAGADISAASKNSKPHKRPCPPARPLPPLEPPSLTRAAAGETREDDPKDETALLARTVVTDILSRLGLTADMSLARLGARLVINLDGPDRALLIGARGATLEALELLVSKIMAKKRPGQTGRLVLDVADYRFRRHNQVLENLKLLMEAARRTGQPQAFTGLNSAERRLVRLALRPVKDLDLKVGRNREALVLAPAAPEPGRRPRKKAKGWP